MTKEELKAEIASLEAQLSISSYIIDEQDMEMERLRKQFKKNVEKAIKVAAKQFKLKYKDIVSKQ